MWVWTDTHKHSGRDDFFKKQITNKIRFNLKRKQRYDQNKNRERSAKDHATIHRHKQTGTY